MKRLAVLFVILILCFSFNAFAEGAFQIHSGVEFGMNQDEVISHEKANGFEPNYLKSGNFNFKGNIAGVDGSTVLYRFDAAGKCYLANYTFAGSMTNYTAHETDYNKIQASLEGKYGASQYSTLNGLEVAVPGQYNGEYTTGVTESRLYNQEYALIGAKEDIVTYNQWVLPQENGTYIVIDHYLMSTKISSTPTLSHTLRYICFDGATFEQYQTENQNKVSNDL